MWGHDLGLDNPPFGGVEIAPNVEPVAPWSGSRRPNSQSVLRRQSPTAWGLTRADGPDAPGRHSRRKCLRSHSAIGPSGRWRGHGSDHPLRITMLPRSLFRCVRGGIAASVVRLRACRGFGGPRFDRYGPRDIACPRPAHSRQEMRTFRRREPTPD